MITMYFMIISRCIAQKTRLLHATAVRRPCILNIFNILKTDAANLPLDSKRTTYPRSGKNVIVVNKVTTCYCCYMLLCILTTSGVPKKEATNKRQFSNICSFNGKPGYYSLGSGSGNYVS